MKKLIVFSAVLIFATAPVLAQLPVKASASPEEIQEKLMEAVKAEFANADLNGDSMLSQEEFVEYTTQEAREKAENTFNGFDTNHDGSLDEEEYFIALQQMMRRLAEQIKTSVGDIQKSE